MYGIQFLRHLNRLRLGHQPIFLEYPVDLRPRWQTERGNPHLAGVLDLRHAACSRNLELIAGLLPVVEELTARRSGPQSINWTNPFIPALDGLSLMWAAERTATTFLEVGSGNSTIFVRTALQRAGRSTKLISIDPAPRKEIDSLCDEVIRSPLERVDLAIFDRLKPGDTLFIDNSHRALMNSDVTVVMLDILPRLSAGVLVGFHDIFLPYDYFESWSQRAYNEQYLLACYLIANPAYFDIELANFWIWRKKMHVDSLEGIWAVLGEAVRDRPPSAFWGIKRSV